MLDFSLGWDLQAYNGNADLVLYLRRSTVWWSSSDSMMWSDYTPVFVMKWQISFLFPVSPVCNHKIYSEALKMQQWKNYTTQTLCKNFFIFACLSEKVQKVRQSEKSWNQLRCQQKPWSMTHEKRWPIGTCLLLWALWPMVLSFLHV